MVSNDFDAGINLGIPLDEATNGRAETGGQTTSGQECDFLGFAHGFFLM
jgi:hypothetical protein